MFRTFCLLVLSAVTALAADISGTWNAQVETDAGNGTPKFVLKQEGEKLTGTYSGALGEARVTGTVKGQDVTIEFNAGGAIIYTGKLDDSGKTITGTCDLGGQASGTFKATKQ
jgi:hypothetical protein